MPSHVDPAIRLANYSDRSGGDDACWPWLGSKNRKGYGGFKAVINGVSVVSAHRAAWVLAGNSIPAPGMVIDHICENPGCVNPAHMRVISNALNVMLGRGACATHARKTHCLRGHRLSGDTLLIDGGGHRQCRICFRAAQRKYATRVALGLSKDDMVVLEATAAAMWAALL